MPELPEVETIRSDLEKASIGAKVLSLETDTPKMLLPSPLQLKKAVKGRKIKGFRRRAKLLIIELEKSNYLLIHLKLTGRLLIRKPSDPPDDWVRVTFKLEKGGKKLELRFSDLRKFGYIKLANGKQLQKVLEDYGPEPLDDLTLEKFKKILVGKKIGIKKLLMDQKRISGIGNIYANEALFIAGIHPEISAGQLSDDQLTKLLEAVEKVLEGGIRYRGTTATDDFYRDAYGKEGHYQNKLLIYQRTGRLCVKCKTPIKRINISGRGTFFCPKCQRKTKD